MAATAPAEGVRLYLDSARFGLGWRFFVLVDPGRLNVTVFHPATLQAERMRIAAARAGQPVTLTPYQWRCLAKRIDGRRRAYKRQGLAHRAALVKQVVQACRSRAKSN